MSTYGNGRVRNNSRHGRGWDLNYPSLSLAVGDGYGYGYGWNLDQPRFQSWINIMNSVCGHALSSMALASGITWNDLSDMFGGASFSARSLALSLSTPTRYIPVKYSIVYIFSTNNPPHYSQLL
ncbi:hypothetical protein SDJN03_24329, partial [Cucurbita argyrosperma subsp. sororia]